MDSKAVLLAIRRGDRVKKESVTMVIESLEKIKAEAAERGMLSTVERIESNITELMLYKRKEIKLRKYGEIQKDIDIAKQLIINYRDARKYELAARWERQRDEYLKEWDMAVMGQAYIPEIMEG